MSSAKQPILFMGTPEFAASSLRALLAAGFPVRAVATQPDRPKGRGRTLTAPPVKRVAEEAGIPVHQPAKIRTPEFTAWLQELGVEYIVVVAYGRILPPEVLAVPPGGCINVHASLLPRWRGASPIQWAIVNGDTETGITTMLMDEGLDTGPMLLQRTVPIGQEESAADLHDRLAQVGGEVLCETLERLGEGGLTSQPQPEQGATYAPLLEKTFGAVDWTLPARRIHDLVRGLYPWPGAYTHAGETYLKLLRSSLVEGAGQSGQVLQVQGDSVDVGTGDGVLRLLEVQPAGKPRMAAAAYFRGARITVGEQLETRRPE